MLLPNGLQIFNVLKADDSPYVTLQSKEYIILNIGPSKNPAHGGKRPVLDKDNKNIQVVVRDIVEEITYTFRIDPITDTEKFLTIIIDNIN
jgi:hypothetical protein